MKFASTHPTFKIRPLPDEIADLAYKFYLDSNRREGHDHENWLCAEYMLTQKEFIRQRVQSFHRHGVAF